MNSAMNSTESSNALEHYKPKSLVEQRALSLLSSGVGNEATAAALGVTPSYISQLLSDSAFSGIVEQKRYENLAEHNVRDKKYDSLEDSLLEKLRSSLPLMIRPAEITKALQTVNGCKRRGSDAPDSSTVHQTVISLVVPAQISERFAVNINNQVIKAGEQELSTIPSSELLKLSEEPKEEPESLEQQTKVFTNTLLQELGE